MRFADSAIHHGTLAIERIDESARDEMRSAVIYAQGAKFLQEAWILRTEAAALGNLEPYCDALVGASSQFERAAQLAPAKSVLRLSAVGLARGREALPLGACSPERRFAQRVAALEWPVSAGAVALESQARLNRARIGELRAQSGLTTAQQQWLLADLALLEAFDRWSAMLGMQDELLRAPAEALPRFCRLKVELQRHLAVAASRYQGVGDSTLPLKQRLDTLGDLKGRVGSRGSLCVE